MSKLPQELLLAIIVALSVALVACWPEEQLLQRSPQIQSQQDAGKPLDRAHPAGNESAALPETNALARQRSNGAPDFAVLGVRIGEWLLIIVTYMLWAATARLVREGRESSGRQLRAYVGISAKDFRFECPSLKAGARDALKKADSKQVEAIFRDFMVITVKNFGETPAYKTTVFAGYSVQPFGERLPDDFFENWPDTDVVPTEARRATLALFTLHRGQTEESKHHVTDVGPLRQAKASPPTKQIYVFGRIYYKDIFGKPWRTKFCYSWEPWHPSGERFVAYQEYNGEDNKELPGVTDGASGDN